MIKPTERLSRDFASLGTAFASFSKEGLSEKSLEDLRMANTTMSGQLESLRSHVKGELVEARKCVARVIGGRLSHLGSHKVVADSLLSQFGDFAVVALIEGLANDNMKIRINSARVMSVMGKDLEAYIPRLVDFFSLYDAVKASAAVTLLVGLGPLAVGELAKVLDHKQNDVRQLALSTLESIGVHALPVIEARIQRVGQESDEWEGLAKSRDIIRTRLDAKKRGWVD